MTTVKEYFIALTIILVIALATLSFIWIETLWSLLILGPLILLGTYDILQKKHSILRLYPVIGHLRFIFEKIRPEIQQYFVEDDTNGMPVSREFRSLVYQRAKGERDTRPFGTQFELNQIGYEWTNHSMFPVEMMVDDPRVVFGEGRCQQPYSAALVNVSAMSYGALSPNAIRALNLGARLGNFAHNTGEGGISPYHLAHEGDLIWQIGTAYFGCRTAEGNFDKEKFAQKAAMHVVKMIEIKLSQGAKPGHGGLLPGKKVTEEVALIRGVEPGKDVVSPPAHSAFKDPIGLLTFVEELRKLSGKPVGFKLSVGRPQEFLAICKAMLATKIVPDFITVDGGEGGTGAAPIEFSNSIGTPLKEALHIVHTCLIGCGLRDQVKVIASGKILSAFHVYRALALGADAVNSARGMMFALGCIQSRHCNTDKCPTGVATQNPVRSSALDVHDKAQRVANYQSSQVYHLKKMMAAAGITSIQDISAEDIFRRISHTEVKSLDEIYPVLEQGCLLYEETVPKSWQKYWRAANAQYWSETQKSVIQESKQAASELTIEEEIKREAEKEASQEENKSLES